MDGGRGTEHSDVALSRNGGGSRLGQVGDPDRGLSDSESQGRNGRLGGGLRRRPGALRESG